MRRLHCYWIGLLVMACNWVQAESNEIILSHDDVSISFSEAYHYSLRHTNPDAYEKSMSQPLAVMRVLENLYVFKRVEQIEASMGLITAEAQSFYMADQSARAALGRYLDFYVEKRMAEVDWEGLAKLDYATRLDEFKTEEQVRVDHVLISIEDRQFDDFVNRTKLVKEAIDLGTDFKTIVTNFSDDPSAEVNHGDLGFFRKGRMQPNFSEAAFSMVEAGQIEGPVMTKYGAHYIRFVAKKESEPIPFERVRDDLMTSSKESTREKIRTELIDEFREEIASDLATIDYGALLERFLATKSATPQ